VAATDLAVERFASDWIEWCADQERADYRLEGRAGELWLVSVEGVVVGSQPVAAEAGTDTVRELLEATCRREVARRFLWQLAAAGGDLPVVADFPPVEAAELEGWDLPMTPVEFPAGTTRATRERALRLPVLRDEARTGKLAILEACNSGTRPVHLTVLSIAESGACYVLWPRRGEADATLAPGGARRVPVQIGADPSWPLPRPMRERYLAIVTSHAADFGPLVDGRLRRGEAGLQAKGFGVASLDLLIERAD
jgi:hypothetical protein